MALRFNPFRPNNLIHPGMFRGRASELLAIEKILFQTKHGNPQHFLIEGERGIGKSSMLLYVNALARGNLPFIQDPDFRGNFLAIDVELAAGMSAFDVVRKLAERLRDQVATRDKLKDAAKNAWDFLSKWEILGVRYHRDGNSNDADPFIALEKLCQTAGDFLKKEEGSEQEDLVDGLIFLIDEADKPDSTARLGEIVKLMSEKMARYSCEKLAIGLAGLPYLVERLKESHESSPRLFSIFTLGPLSKKDCQEVIETCLKEAREKNRFETRITDDARDTLCGLSEGYPHFIQQFGFSAFDADTDNVIDLADVQRGAYGKNGALEQLGKKFFQEQYFDQIGSEDYRKVLQLMAENSDQWISRAELIKKTSLKDHTVNNALQALKGRNIIIANDAQKGSYRLPTKSFAAWIKALSQAPIGIAASS